MPSSPFNGRLSRALLLACCLLAAQTLPAQEDHVDDAWRWIGFTTESGLPSNEVTSLAETDDGTVWANTSAGLAWFDGFQWRRVPGAPPQRLGVVYPYGRSRVVGNLAGVVYVVSRDSAAALPLRDVGLGAPLDSGTLIVRMEKSLYLYAGGKLRPMQGASDSVNGSIDILWKTRSGDFWIRTQSGMYRWAKDHWTKELWRDAGEVAVTAMEEDRRGGGIAAVLLPLAMRGLWEWPYGGAPMRNAGEMGYDVRALDISASGDAIVVYNSGDIRLRKAGRWSGLPSVQARLGEIDFVQWRTNGDLWFGTERGLYLYRQSSSRWEVLSHPSPDGRNAVNEIVRTRSGDLWIGTADGIDIYRASGRAEHIAAIGATRLYTVTGLAEDAGGNIWISSGATFDGAFRWDGKSWEHFQISDDPQGGRFHKIRTDRLGRIWFLGISRRYDYRGAKEVGAYLLSDGKFYRWGEEEGLSNGRVYSFVQTADNALWFASLRGLSRWVPEPGKERAERPSAGGRWTHWSRGRGLLYDKIFALAADSSGRVWFGHANSGSGLGIIDRDDSVRYVTAAEGLTNEYVWDLSVDSGGTVWVATDGGLCSFARGAWLTYDERSGLHFSKLWPVVPIGSQVYVGTRGKGVAIFNRGESPWRLPRIVIDRPVVEDRDVHIRWKAYAYWGDESPGEIMTRYRVGGAPWSPWSTSREIVERNYPSGDHTVRVQARGLVGNFEEAGAEAAFSVMPPYYLRPIYFLPVGLLAFGVVALAVVLLARKRRHDLELRKSEAKFRAVAQMSPSAIVIYQDGSFLFANPGAEALTGFTGDELHRMTLADLLHPDDRGAMRQREEDRGSESSTIPNRAEFRIVTKQGAERWVDYRWGWIRFQGAPATLGTAFDISERKQAEEQLRLLTTELTLTEERERHRMATYLHDVIGQTLALCRIKIRGLERSAPPEAFSAPLNEVRELVDLSIRNTRSLTFELCPPILYELSFEAAVGWLAEELHQQHGVVFEVRDDHEPKPLNEEMRTILFQALREIFVNVIKHAEASRVDVTLGRDAEHIRIVVQDDGAGFDVATLARPAGGSGGFGLFNIRERLKYLGGVIDVASSPGAGARVTISAPLKQGGDAPPSPRRVP